MGCRGVWLARLELGREVEVRDSGPSGLKLWHLLGKLMWKLGSRPFWCVVKIPLRTCCPHAGGNFWISPAVVSNKHLHCPVRSKIRNEWFCSFIAGGNVEWCSLGKLRKTVWQFLKKLNVNLPYDPDFHSWGSTQEKWKRLSTQRPGQKCSQQHHSQQSTKWKQTKGPSTDEWIKKMAIIQWITTQQYATSTDLNNIMQSERSQIQKTTYGISLFLWKVQNEQIYRDRK